LERLTLLAFTLVVKAIATQPEQVLYPLYIWFIALGMLAVVLIISVINTFTEMTGFVHPDDKMMANMLVFIMAIGTLLVYGLLEANMLVFIMAIGTLLVYGLLEGVDTIIQGYLFDMGTMIVIAYIFLFIFNFYGSKISEGAETGQVKEMTSRFMLVSLILGVIMAGVNLMMNIFYELFGYAWGSGILMLFAVGLVFMIVIFLGRRYEPVGE